MFEGQTMLEGKAAYRYCRRHLGFFTYWRCRIVDALANLRCKHNDLEFVRNIYGDEIIERGWKRSIWKCARCGKIVMRDQLHELPNAALTGGPEAQP